MYFSAGAPDGTASTEEVVMFPVGQLSHFEMASATQLRVYFHSNQEQDAVGIDSAHAVLTIDTGKHKEVLSDVTAALNKRGNMITIADEENSVYASPYISACASIAVVDAS